MAYVGTISRNPYSHFTSKRNRKMATVSIQAPSRLNPYQTPAVAPQGRLAASKEQAGPVLHGVRSIGIATFLGGVIAGSILMARNFWQLGQSVNAIACVAFAIVWQAFLVALAIVLPSGLPGGFGVFIGLVHAFAFQHIATAYFAKEYAMIAQGHGRSAHWSMAVLVTVGTLIVTLYAVVQVTVILS